MVTVRLIDGEYLAAAVGVDRSGRINREFIDVSVAVGIGVVEIETACIGGEGHPKNTLLSAR